MLIKSRGLLFFDYGAKVEELKGGKKSIKNSKKLSFTIL